MMFYWIWLCSTHSKTLDKTGSIEIGRKWVKLVHCLRLGTGVTVVGLPAVLQPFAGLDRDGSTPVSIIAAKVLEYYNNRYKITRLKTRCKTKHTTKSKVYYSWMCYSSVTESVCKVGPCITLDPINHYRSLLARIHHSLHQLPIHLP